jgi:hypothetical protein
VATTAGLKKARKERERTPLSSLSFSLILLENQMGRLLFYLDRGSHVKKGKRTSKMGVVSFSFSFLFLFLSVLEV